MRVNVVEKARASRSPRYCRRCGKQIVAGERYYFIEPRYGPRAAFCSEHYPRPSETTSNETVSELYAAQENLLDAAKDWDGVDISDLEGALSDAADAADEAEEAFNEKADNMEQYFSGSEQIDTLRENAENAAEWSQSLRSVSLEEFVEDVEGADREAWMSEQRDIVEQAAQELGI